MDDSNSIPYTIRYCYVLSNGTLYRMPRDGYGSVSVPEGDLERAEDSKPDDVTWGDVLVAGAKELNGTGSESDYRGDDVTELVAELKNELSMANEPGVEIDVDKLMNSLNTIEERTGRIESTLEGLR